MDRYRNVCVWLLGRHKNVFCTKQVHVKLIWKHFLYNFMVLLNRPVKNALFWLMDRYRNVCVWFMARNCRLQRLELTVANVGTTDYHCKELPVRRGWNSMFPTWEPWVTIASNCRFPEVGTHASQPGNHRLPLQELLFPKGWNWRFPTWEPKVTMARNCRFPDLETYGSQPGNQRLPLQGIAGSQKLEFMFSKLSNYHCKELPVAKAWNSWFQTWQSIRYQWKDLLIPKS